MKTITPRTDWILSEQILRAECRRQKAVRSLSCKLPPVDHFKSELVSGDASIPGSRFQWERLSKSYGRFLKHDFIHNGEEKGVWRC